jgi:hypothetical protein
VRLIGPFRSRAALEAEILSLRHQLNILQRNSPKRMTPTSVDRLLLVALYRLSPWCWDALKTIKPSMLLRHSGPAHLHSPIMSSNRLPVAAAH